MYKIKRFTPVIISGILFSCCGCKAAQNIASVRYIHSQKDTFSVAETNSVNTIEKVKNPQIVTDWDRRMPWIVALSIGLFGLFGNIFISNKVRKTSLEINKRDFNKTVLSANRQLWITEFRCLMSQVITDLTYYNSKENLTEAEFASFSLLLTKAQLMLTNSSDDSFNETLDKLHAASYSILKKSPNDDDLETLLNQIKKHTVLNIQSEWDKVTKGE